MACKLHPGLVSGRATDQRPHILSLTRSQLLFPSKGKHLIPPLFRGPFAPTSLDADPFILGWCVKEGPGLPRSCHPHPLTASRGSAQTWSLSPSIPVAFWSRRTQWLARAPPALKARRGEHGKPRGSRRCGPTWRAIGRGCRGRGDDGWAVGGPGPSRGAPALQIRARWCCAVPSAGGGMPAQKDRAWNV